MCETNGQSKPKVFITHWSYNICAIGVNFVANQVGRYGENNNYSQFREDGVFEINILV